MEDTHLSKYTVSFGLALAITSLVNAVIVIAKESSQAVMAGMQKVTGHHWTTHSAVVLLVFVGLGWLFARTGIRMSIGKLITTLVGGVVLSGLLIAGFYLIGD